VFELASLGTGGPQAFRGVLGGVVEGLGVAVLLPVVLFVLAKLARAGTSQAAKSAVTFGIGYVGIFLVLGLLAESIAPLSVRLAETTGVSLTAVDAGWPAAAAIAFGVVEIGLWIVPVYVVFNLLLLSAGFTFTLNVDVWNYWHFAFVGGLVYVATGGWLLSMAVAMTLGLLVLVGADWFQPAIEETFDQAGVSVPHAMSLSFAVVALPVYAVVRRLPVVGTASWDPDAVQDRLGLLGEPALVGVAIGLGLGLGANATDLASVEAWYSVFGAGIAFGAVLHILPMMGEIVVEGLTPLMNAVRESMTGRYEDRDILVGLDAAILVGHPSVAAAGLVMVPVAVVMSLVLPGNRVLWAVDLATFPFVFAMLVPLTDGDVLDLVVTGTVLLVPVHYFATWVAPLFTELTRSIGADVPEEATFTAALGDAGLPTTGLLVLPGQEFGLPGAAASLLAGVGAALLLWVALRRWPKRMYMLVGASEEKAEETLRRRHTPDPETPLPNKLGDPVEPDE